MYLDVTTDCLLVSQAMCTFRLEAEDLVFQLGKSPRSGVSDLGKVNPSHQQNIPTEVSEVTHFMAVIMGGGPHIKTFSSPTDLEGI